MAQVPVNELTAPVDFGVRGKPLKACLGTNQQLAKHLDLIAESRQLLTFCLPPLATSCGVVARIFAKLR